MNPSITIVIPAYNEESSLASHLPDVIRYVQDHQWQLIVVDDGSTDRTGEILSAFSEQSGVRIIRHKVNRGYGAALKTGILAAETEMVVSIDADGQHSIEEVEKMISVKQNQDADLVIGSRINQRPTNAYRSVGKWLIRSITKIMLPMQIEDLNSGCKLYSTVHAKKYLAMCPDSMAFSEVIVLVFLNQGNKVIECPIQVAERRFGASKISTRTAFETILEIFNLVMLLKPMRIFLPLSFLSILVGVLWGIPFIVMGRGVSVGSTLAILSGGILFSLGLVAEQLSAIRKGFIDLHERIDHHQPDSDEKNE
jgi:glycosyltransferase involved in cell wall biosynthesis